MSHLTKAILWLIFSLLMLFCCVACGIEAEQTMSTTEVEVTPETSAAPIESSIPETSAPPTSELEIEIEPEEILLPEPEEPSVEEFWEVSKLIYPVATEIWLQMKSYGWTDAACAGIMGNIMRESGGDMLSWIDPDARYNGHYGLCQWSYKYYQDIHPHNGWAPSISEQIEYLRYTIINKDILHYNYGFDEEYLKTVTDYREAARVFHEEYEVSGASSVPRQNNAQDAWEWFVLRTEYNNNWLIQK